MKSRETLRRDGLIRQSKMLPLWIVTQLFQQPPMHQFLHTRALDMRHGAQRIPNIIREKNLQTIGSCRRHKSKPLHRGKMHVVLHYTRDKLSNAKRVTILKYT